MTIRLEDMLNDCAVIRTTFDTFDVFPAEDPIRKEIWEIIEDARANLRRCCSELCADISNLTALDQPLDVQKFSEGLRTLLLVGYSRRLFSYMKLNVFQSVPEAVANENKPDPLYRYELLPPLTVASTFAMSAQQLATTIFEDLLRNLETDAHYTDKYAFDRNVFQKYVAILFACYATTDPPYYA